jgi:hypothetical protein
VDVMAFRGIEQSLEAGSRAVLPPATDLKRWSLEVDEGRQVSMLSTHCTPLHTHTDTHHNT